MFGQVAVTYSLLLGRHLDMTVNLNRARTVCGDLAGMSTCANGDGVTRVVQLEDAQFLNSAHIPDIGTDVHVDVKYVIDANGDGRWKNATVRIGGEGAERYSVFIFHI